MELEPVAGEVNPTALRALVCLEELALQKGLDEVSMRDVAKRLGVSLAALQYHFPTKAALLEAFVTRTVDQYRNRIHEVLATSRAGERFANLVRFVMNEALQTDRHQMLAMIEGRAIHDSAAMSAIGLFFRSYLEIMRDALVADTPDLPPREALLKVISIVSMLEGLPSLIGPAGDLGIDRDGVLDAIFRMSTEIGGAGNV